MAPGFHPAVRTWFERRFPEGPTAAQHGGWPHIAAGEHTLIAAPTGSGKTLAGFLACIDALYRAAERGDEVEGVTQVVYVSPLKALAVDVQQNLETPLREIATVARELGFTPPALRAQVRTGDTPSSLRAAMLRQPPNFLVTTPESLYLLLTAEGSRKTLTRVETVIVDEVHSLARDKRGSHLTLTLERLTELCERPPARVGLSATQKPIETIARLLVGAGPDRVDAAGEPRCAIVDVGHQRDWDLAIELPADELGAVATREQFEDTLDRIAELVQAHRTTLVFVNTRNLSERVAHLLAERVGDEGVAAHHGSLSRERRVRVEQQLRAGQLRALVATASLELGIDIGPIDLVCQIASPRSLGTFLQRVGRSGHTRTGTPRGRLFPMTRDELVECCALLAGVRAGRLDAVLPPRRPLDVLAQQIVAECAARECSEDGLFGLCRRAHPFVDLSREDFDEIVDLVSGGIATGRGRVAAYVHRDRVNGTLKGRRGARLAALTSGGAIPETGDYRVVAEPDETFIGTVNEDWAIESNAGDIFLLGSTSWRILRVSGGTVRVADAKGAPPTVPFWLGEAPARTWELSDEVSQLGAAIESLLAQGNADQAVAVVQERCGVDNEVAASVVWYLAAGRSALGRLPTQDHLIVERFFDDSGGMQVVVHSPFGGRLNRALGLALRKRFCMTFDFELQAAATENGALLSLGPQHSFPLEDLTRFLSSGTVEEVLRKAAILAPMFQVRWRHTLNRALTVLRFRGGRKNPPPLQRLQSDDVMVAVFPALAACQENATGPIEIVDHPLVRETLWDCLHDFMDVDGLRTIVEGIERGEIQVTCRDTTEPSVLAHEILNSRPYTFLDDAPLEERRSRNLSLPRGLPLDPRDLSALDPDAIARVREEARPEPRDADELHDLLMAQVLVPPRPEWEEWFSMLADGRRAMRVDAGGGACWCAAEWRAQIDTLLEDPLSVPEAAAAAVRGHLDSLGPATAAGLSDLTTLPVRAVEMGLAALEAEGFAFRGRFDPALGSAEQWCARRLLLRIHGYTRQRLRREIEPVTPADFMRFLLRWQRVAPGAQHEGRGGLAETVAQLQGFEIPAGSWERDVLPARVARYDPVWLDHLCLTGEVAWGRLRVREGVEAEAGASPSRATPVTLMMRADLPWLLQAARGEAHPAEPGAGTTRAVLGALCEHGAQFTSDLVARTGRSVRAVEEALWDGVARGLVTADGFAAVRGLLAGRRRTQWQPPRRRLRRGAGGVASSGGRWSVVPQAAPVEDREQLAEAVAEQLLARWGVVFRDLLAREVLAVPWRDVLWALRRLEARGTVRGGRFVNGFPGEQFALPEAVDLLRSVRRTEGKGEVVTISAADPLNLVGIVTPGPRVVAIGTNTVTYRDGIPVEDVPPAVEDEEGEASVPYAPARAVP